MRVAQRIENMHRFAFERRTPNKRQMVTGGNEQFGVTGADQILIARSKGVPVVALAVVYRRNPFVLFSLAKSGINGPADYIGKKVGLKIGGNEELIYRAILAKVKIDKSALTEIPVKFDITPLLTGTVDVWPGYLINEVLAAKEKGFAVNVVYPSDYGIDLYADTLFTTETVHDPVPYSCLSPPDETVVAGGAWAIANRQIAPWCA